MKEEFLHYIWKYKKINLSKLETTAKEEILLKSVGKHNKNAGPDFFNAQIRIAEQWWAGNVEIHIKSSDWYAHGHEEDPNYDNVILHIVWEHDVEVYRKNNTTIPTLEIKEYVEGFTITNYNKLLKDKKFKWINCEKQIFEIPGFTLAHWKERLYFERLERKGKLIEELLQESKNDWEVVLFQMLIKNFGLKVNGEAFLSIGKSIPFNVIRKNYTVQLKIEALFMGQAGIIPDQPQEQFAILLKNEYKYLVHKYRLNSQGVLPTQFFRLRPPNFPTIRLSQLATLYSKNQNLFDRIIKTKKIEDFYELFKVETSNFWKTHYTFEKETNEKKKRLTKSFIDLILINTILPIKFYHAKKKGSIIDEEIIGVINEIKKEKNAIIERFDKLKVQAENAFDTQALLELKNNYCDQQKCLQCELGNYLLNKK